MFTRYSSRASKTVRCRWLGQCTAPWQSAPNHNPVLFLYTLQELPVPSGWSWMRRTDVICFALLCFASLEDDGRAEGCQPQPCAHLQVLPYGSQSPYWAPTLVQMPLHMKWGWGKSPPWAPWVFLPMRRFLLGSSEFIRESNHVDPQKIQGFDFFSFHDISGHPSEADNCLRQRREECLAPQKIPIGQDIGPYIYKVWEAT